MSHPEHKPTSMSDHLSKQTFIFGLRLWVVLGIGLGIAIVFVLFVLSVWLTTMRNRTQKRKNSRQPRIPNVPRDIQEIRVDHDGNLNQARVQPDPFQGSDINGGQALHFKTEEESPTGLSRIRIDIGKDHRIVFPERFGRSSSHGSTSEARSGDQFSGMVIPEVSHLGWGHWFTLRELEVSTNEFADENVIGEGGYGIVYYGILPDGTHIAVKNLFNNRGQAAKEFEVEVEAIGRVRHKNLVRLLGYCVEGAYRMLVYEHVDNGNLEQWLHSDVGLQSPLTWDIRMQIILGTAKGLAYLHEGLEPKVVHRDIKSSNILLDKHWNSKVSDFGLAKLLGSESSYVRTRVMGTFGCVAPEYASTGMLNERSDVYSFGILIMEIVSGRNPVDYNRLPEEVNLVEWLKRMVANRDLEGILDPKLPEKPSSRALKRALIVALRCVDPNALKRPKMGHVVHMLQTDFDSSFRDDQTAGKDTRWLDNNSLEDGSQEKKVQDSKDTSEQEINALQDNEGS